ncbi:helix-turn-helix domain-containing protein [Chitinophaga sp. ysch24]|uniref:Helix-turn-helix domain-containing protein n=1 Tax=Chitinophaga tropicalis TaxID=2683588 RepID=A0A7K1TY57_9BACT|nr:helix-turn-helix domain-containing protein [Chitinophaga tropicalis]
MTFAGIFNTLLLLGTLQGFIVCGMLFFSKVNIRQNKILAVLILLMTLACLNLYLYGATWISRTSIIRAVLNLNLIPLVIVMPFGPLLYFYVKSVSSPEFRLTKKERWHFYPVIIDIGSQLAAVVFITGILTGTLKNRPGPWGMFIDTYNVYADIPRWLSVTIYLWMASRYLTKVKIRQESYLKWLHQFVRVFLIFQAIWFIYLVPYVIPQLTDWVLNTVDWYPVYIPLVILIYYLGIKGLLMPAREEMPAVKTTPISADVITTALPLLEKAMKEDKLYLDPALNLALMSQHTGLPQKTISSVLNQHLQKSFNDFVNGYRIETFKEKTADSRFDHLTIMGLALESGFNSLPTFQRVFKNTMGISPREYISSQQKKRVIDSE